MTRFEEQVVTYRDNWIERRTQAALACDMKAVRECQDHIDAAAKQLVAIAAGKGLA